MEMKNYPKLCISLLWNPRGGIYRHQENRGPGDKPWPEGARAPRLGPRFRGPLVAVRATHRVARGPFCPLSVPEPGFDFAAPGFDEISLLGQWLS